MRLRVRARRSRSQRAMMRRRRRPRQSPFPATARFSRSATNVDGIVSLSETWSFMETIVATLVAESYEAEVGSISMLNTVTLIGGEAVTTIVGVSVSSRSIVYSTFVGVQSRVVFVLSERPTYRAESMWSNAMIIGFVLGAGIVFAARSRARSTKTETIFSTSSSGGDENGRFLGSEDIPVDPAPPGMPPAPTADVIGPAEPELFPALDTDVIEWPSDGVIGAEVTHRKSKRQTLERVFQAGEVVGWIGSDWRRFVPDGWIWSQSDGRYVPQELTGGVVAAAQVTNSLESIVDPKVPDSIPGDRPGPCVRSFLRCCSS